MGGASLNMSDEEAACALERAHAIRGGHLGVVTKLVRKAEDSITTATGPQTLH